MTDNELIARFLKEEIHAVANDGTVFLKRSKGLHPIVALYHSHWEWLMPVVEKVSQHIYESYPEQGPYGKSTIMQHDRVRKYEGTTDTL